MPVSATLQMRWFEASSSVVVRRGRGKGVEGFMGMSLNLEEMPGGRETGGVDLDAKRALGRVWGTRTREDTVEVHEDGRAEED